MDVVMTVAGRRVAITADRQQILELLDIAALRRLVAGVGAVGVA